MRHSTPSAEVLNRREGISLVRRALLKLTSNNKCACRVLAERRLLCWGFDGYSDDEIRKAYSWFLRKHASLQRVELEELANAWQLEQEQRYSVSLACDLQERVHDTCNGWDSFTNDQIAEACFELTGRSLTIV